jgi:S1-C subfamily serine protease
MMTRETRLLLATIALSVVVVLMLSTLRFPDTPRIGEAPPAPLERLAASAAYEQLARSVERVSRRVSPDLVVVRIEDRDGRGPQGLVDLLHAPAMGEGPRFLPALRVGDARAMLTGTGDPGASVGGPNGLSIPVIAVDALRRLSLLAVPRASSATVAALTLSELQTPTYVVVAEGTAAGVAFRPVFVGSADRFSDPRWTRELLAVSGTPLTGSGALVFSLEGQFLGAAVVQPNGTFAIAGAAELIAVATELGSAGRAAATDFGMTVQALTPDLSRILAVPRGVVVASIDPMGPASRALAVVDVITSINGTAVTNSDDALVRLARTPTGGTAQLMIVRRGQPMNIVMTAEWPVAPESPAAAEAPIFERVAGTGTLVIALSPRSPLARGGVRTGDLIFRAGDLAAPTPVQLTAALRDASTTGLVLVVRRDGDGDRVIAVPPDAEPR